MPQPVSQSWARELAPARTSTARLTPVLVGAMLAVAVATTAAYYVSTPAPLPTSEETVTASIPAGQSVYLGVFKPPEDFGRVLHLTGVRIDVVANTEVTVVPLVCQGGDLGVTTQPQQACTTVVDPEGVDLDADDDLILQVTGASGSIAVIDRVALGFREGARWGTVPAGSPAEIRILPR